MKDHGPTRRAGATRTDAAIAMTVVSLLFAVGTAATRLKAIQDEKLEAAEETQKALGDFEKVVDNVDAKVSQVNTQIGALSTIHRARAREAPVIRRELQAAEAAVTSAARRVERQTVHAEADIAALDRHYGEIQSALAVLWLDSALDEKAGQQLAALEHEAVATRKTLAEAERRSAAGRRLLERVPDLRRRIASVTKELDNVTICLHEALKENARRQEEARAARARLMQLKADVQRDMAELDRLIDDLR